MTYTDVQSIIQLTQVGLQALITKSYSKGIHVVPTFNFTINGTVSVFIVSGNH